MIKFTKMEGIGNDYIYLDGIHQNIPMDKAFIKKISNRHIGIGSDGMIVILESDKADFKMRMFNLDGSEAKMCGNGIRCFAKFVYDHKLTNKTHMSIETLSGIRYVDRIDDNTFRVDMGKPSISPESIPMNTNHEMINEVLRLNNKDYVCTVVSMGNPHIVTYVDDLDFDINEIGPLFEHHSLFPESINTEFIEIISRQYIKMRVWERGSGETKACGTGACACMYACYLNGLCDQKVTVELLGGTLEIEYDNGHIYMTGQANTTFEGEYYG